MNAILRPAADVLAEHREAGESITGPRVADESLHLEIDKAVFAVSDEIEDEQVIGYTWATYASAEALAEGDYSEHDGGLTERELVDAIARFREQSSSWYVDIENPEAAVFGDLGRGKSRPRTV